MLSSQFKENKKDSLSIIPEFENASISQLKKIAMLSLRKVHAMLYGDDWYAWNLHRQLVTALAEAGADLETFMLYEDDIQASTNNLKIPFNSQGKWQERKDYDNH